MAVKDNPKKGIASIALLEVGLFEIGFVVVVIAIVLGVLNYFNIISLSQLYPDKFGFLPHQTLKESTQQNQSVPQITFACPVEKKLCNTGKEIYDGGTFLGIGYNLPIGKKIYAAIPSTAVFGGAEEKSKGISSHSKIVIGGTGVSQGYVVTYEYFGLPKTQGQTKNVLQAEELGAVWGGSFPKEGPYNGINLLVKITKNTGEDVRISEFE